MARQGPDSQDEEPLIIESPVNASWACQNAKQMNPVRASSDTPKNLVERTAHAPTLSIGMPVYNGAQFISQSLDSLLKQTFSDFEIIICDNASEDATQAICREYARRDSRIRYYRNPANLGAGWNYRHA